MLQKTISGLSVIASMLALSTTLASASTTSFDYKGTYHGNNKSEIVTVMSPTRIRSYVDGLVLENSNTSSQFVAWCIDIFTRMQRSAAYQHSTNGNLNEKSVRDLEHLFASYEDIALDNEINSGAFQLAVWEIVYDQTDDQSAYDVQSGSFLVENVSTEVANTANNWLANFSEDRSDLSFYVSDKSQSFVTVAPVPIPAGILLIFTALVALLVFRHQGTAS